MDRKYHNVWSVAQFSSCDIFHVCLELLWVVPAVMIPLCTALDRRLSEWQFVLICRSHVYVILCYFGDPLRSKVRYVPGLVSCSSEGFLPDQKPDSHITRCQANLCHHMLKHIMLTPFYDWKDPDGHHSVININSNDQPNALN